MDIYQRIKNILGFSSNGIENEHFNRPPSQSYSNDHNNESQLPRTNPNHYDSFGFNVFSNPLEMHRYFEHQMNEMLKNFGIFATEDSFFGNNFGGHSDPFFGQNPFGHNDTETFQFPSIDEFNKENKLRSGSLRDQYLKPGYETVPRGQRKIDNDVDEKFNMNELDTVLKPSPQVQPRRFFFGQSMTTKTIQNPDGTIESHKTIRDQDGNEETQVTKRFGDKEYSVITKRNKDGAQEVIENMVNIDQNEKEQFLKRDHRKLTDFPNDFPYHKYF